MRRWWSVILVVLVLVALTVVAVCAQDRKFSLVCDPVPGVDGFKLYVAVPGGVWETVPYREATFKGQQVAMVVDDLSVKLPWGTTKVYLKTFNSTGEESEARVRTFYRSSVVLALPGSARSTEYYSWW